MNYISVKELCKGSDNLLKQLKMSDSAYVVPTYSW